MQKLSKFMESDEDKLKLKEFDDTKKASRAVGNLAIVSEDDYYGTPYEMYWKACRDFKINPKVDVCASDEMHVTDVYLTPKENFMKTEVDADAFGNFPYTQQYQCMERAYQLYQKYNKNWLILAYAKTDTRWWHNFVEGKAETHFIRRRVHFIKNGFRTKNSAPYPSVWIIYRRKGLLKRFYQYIKYWVSNRMGKNKLLTR